MRAARLIPTQLWLRRCRGCDNPEPHLHHLTWLGRAALFGVASLLPRRK